MVELSDNIVSLPLFIGSFLLEHLKVFLITLLLLSNFSLIVLDSGVIALLSTFTFLLETSLESVTLDFEKALKLEELFFRFLLHLMESVLKVTGLLVEFFF
jgi:hypothetical protein